VKVNTTLNGFLTDENRKKPSGVFVTHDKMARSGVFVTHDKMARVLKASLGDGLHGVFLGGVGLERNDIEKTHLSISS